jgi:hypothetical protein
MIRDDIFAFYHGFIKQMYLMLVWVTPVKPPAHDIIKRFDLFMGYIG